MKKIFISMAVLAVVMFVAVPAFAHPPVPVKPTLPTEAATGLHTACGNLNPEGIAYHVFYYFLSPHYPAAN